MSTSRTGLLAAATAAGVALFGLGTPGTAAGDPAGQSSGSTGSFQGDAQHSMAKDTRDGQVAPLTAQRHRADATDAAVRWNMFGTPASVTDEGALVTGLPADPTQAARQYVQRQQGLFGLSDAQVAALEVVNVAPIGQGAAVLMRQRFGDLPAGYDGLLVVGVRDGSVYSVSGSLSRDTGAPAPATLSRDEALASAARDAGLALADVARHRVREVAVPTPADGVRAAYQVVLLEAGAAEPTGVASYVDGRTGEVLVREDLVDHAVRAAEDNPEWEVFEDFPPTDYSATDTRVRWCWTPRAGCDEAMSTSASPLPWDVDPATAQSTTTTDGNNAFAVHNWFSNDSRSVGMEKATARPDRDYAYEWTNQWAEEKCSPDVFVDAARNDIDAARANLFAGHNRMHDWAYHLGFTESAWNLQKDNFGKGGLGNDPESGNAQAGGVSGGPPTFAARDNANQFTPPDGMAPITNMYLWQPIAAGFYAPCVDGDFDQTVIGHEYTHAISNRMVAGPDTRLDGQQANAMGESWSDLMAMEYLNENGYVPEGAKQYVIGEYVTGDSRAGIRNYDMSSSPLNYSDIAYDLVGQQVHADGEIWSAANFDIRRAMIARYGSGSAADQKACARGERPADQCPGNRRWVQLVFDAWLLTARGDLSMLDMRDAMIAADQIRFGGANQALLWNVFASRGFGEGASSNTVNDADPVPSFSSPYASEATVKFRPVGADEQIVPDARLYVGRFQGRAMPVADTDPSTPLGDKVAMVPGSYEFVAQAPGRGHLRVPPTTLRAGQARELLARMRVNLASASAGAAVTGDGINVGKLVDDDEATNWASLGGPVAGKQVTVDLVDGVQTVRRVQVSAMLRPTDANDPGGDTGGQSRYSALRQFRVLACTATGSVDCTDAAHYREVYTSPEDAFPSTQPRPRSPELILRSFEIPRTLATHLRFEVVTNQCTGAPDYAGEQDADPRAATDCAAASTQDENVRAAEFQAFAQ